MNKILNNITKIINERRHGPFVFTLADNTTIQADEIFGLQIGSGNVYLINIISGRTKYTLNANQIISFNDGTSLITK